MFQTMLGRRALKAWSILRMPGPKTLAWLEKHRAWRKKKKTQKLEDDQSIWADPPDVVHLPEWPIFVRPGEKNALAEKALKLGHPPVIVIPSGDRNSPG